MNHVFLKYESQMVSKTQELFDKKEYEKISAMGEFVFDNLAFYKETKVLSEILYSMFVCHYFEEIVTFVSELMKRDVNEYEYMMYCMASLISLDDLYMAKSIIKKSVLFKDASTKHYIEDDGANYSLISLIKDIKKSSCLLLVNYIYKYDDEGIDQSDLRILKYYEMIDSVYSFGSNNKLVEYMNEIGKIIFA